MVKYFYWLYLAKPYCNISWAELIKINKKAKKNSKTYKTKGPENWFSKKKVVVVNVWHLVSTVEKSLRNEWFARIKRENTPYQRLLHFYCPFSTWKSKFIGIYLNELQLLRISANRTFCNFNTKFWKLQKTLFNWIRNRSNVCMYMYLSISHHMKYIYIYIHIYLYICTYICLYI